MIIASTGPYVLIAVAAFMAGVIVTVALIKNRKKENRQISENRGNTESEENGCHRDQESFQRRKS